MWCFDRYAPPRNHNELCLPDRTGNYITVVTTLSTTRRRNPSNVANGADSTPTMDRGVVSQVQNLSVPNPLGHTPRESIPPCTTPRSIDFVTLEGTTCGSEVDNRKRDVEN